LNIWLFSAFVWKERVQNNEIRVLYENSGLTAQ
jgi:hypothetical protein